MHVRNFDVTDVLPGSSTAVKFAVDDVENMLRVRSSTRVCSPMVNIVADTLGEYDKMHVCMLIPLIAQVVGTVMPDVNT
jgi:hypothetical protein